MEKSPLINVSTNKGFMFHLWGVEAIQDLEAAYPTDP